MLEEHGFYELLRASGVFPDRATQRISAKNASAVEARLLDESKGTALVTMERTTYDARGRAIEFAQHVYRASRYALCQHPDGGGCFRESGYVMSIDSSY